MTNGLYAVATAPNAAPAPEVEGAVDNTLSYDTLNGKNVVVKIARQESWEAGQILQLIWRGTTSDGKTLPPHAQTQELTAEDIFNGATVEVANVHAKDVINGSALIFYQVDFGEMSMSLTLSITGATLPSFYPAEVDGVTQGVVIPDTLPERGATARVKFQAPMNLGDRVTLTATYTNEKDNKVVEEFPQVPFLNNEDLTFTLRLDYIKAAAPGTLKLEYTVNVVGSKDELPAPPLDLHVGYGIIPPKFEGTLPPPLGDAIKVTVPEYSGMVGDEIAIFIDQPHVKYRSSTMKPNELEDLTFEIPPGIFVSSLNILALVHYEVSRRTDDNKTKEWTSLPLKVRLALQSATIAPPTYLSFADTAPRYHLSYPEISSGDKVKVYWQAEGKARRETELTIDKDGNYYYVPIPMGWLTEDKGRTICGNYSIVQDGSTSIALSPAVVFRA